jgi:hypothetical protein
MSSLNQVRNIIINMLGKHAYEARKALIMVGEAAIEGERDNASILAYHEAQAKVFVLDELLEKIANTPNDTGEVKHNPFCNHSIYDSTGNEIARAKRMDG